MKKNGISFPRSVYKLEQQLNKKQEKEDQDDNKCNIAGLNKAEGVLYQAAKPGNYWVTREPTDWNGLHYYESYLAKNGYEIDYLGGKPLKVSLSGDTFDPFLYNRENENNAAQNAIAALKDTN